MTTNYLLVELTAKMEHEERLRRARQCQSYFHSLATSAPRIGTSWLQPLRNLVTGRHISNQQFTATPAFATQPDAQREITTASSRTVAANPTTERFFTEEEWMLLFRMIKNRKLSVEQAAQLLVTMNG